jgi:hypothetical protein
VAVVTTVALLGAAVFAVVGSSDDGSSERGASVDDETGGGSASGEGELTAVVDEISAFVAEERGLEFQEPVDVELEDDEGFEQRLLEDFEEEQESFAESQVLYQALGLIEPDADLMELFREAYAVGVVGFYDPETDELVVRGTDLSPSVRVTIAHELTHALDDQHFDIDRTEYDDSDDEIGFGFSALLEGQATVVEEAYLASLSGEEQDQYYDELLEQVGGGIPDVPEVLIEMIVAPYSEGPGFVEALSESGGQEALDAAYDEPPTTSEQVLEPEAYLEGEGAVAVEHPVADGEAVDEMLFGQLAVGLVLETGISGGDAEEAADGWGGDWLTWWEDGERSCMRATFVGDTPEDTEELGSAWSEWADNVDLEATVDQAAAADPVTVTSCTS